MASSPEAAGPHPAAADGMPGGPEDPGVDRPGLWRLLFMSMIYLLNRVESDVKDSDGLTLLDLGVLFALGHAEHAAQDGAGPGLPMGRLAELFAVDASVVTYRLKRLEERGLARRIRAADDGRLVLARRTDEGRAALTRARGSMLGSADRHFFAHVGAEQQQVLAEVFTALHAVQRDRAGR
jgi:DNA-binding MarR family transcriptional regulator